MTARAALELATVGGASVLGRDDIGRLAPGLAADFIAIDFDRLEFAGAMHDPIAAVVMCSPATVDHSWVAGRAVIRDGRLVAVGDRAADRRAQSPRSRALRVISAVDGGPPPHHHRRGVGGDGRRGPRTGRGHRPDGRDQLRACPSLERRQLAARSPTSPSGRGTGLGAGVTWSRIESAGPPALAQAARTVGSPQIRNAGTLGGNVGTASPAGDGLPFLAAVDASIELTSKSGPRTLPWDEFFVGVKETARLAGELITAIRLPDDLPERQHFGKIGVRNAMVIATRVLCGHPRSRGSDHGGPGLGGADPDAGAPGRGDDQFRSRRRPKATSPSSPGSCPKR